MHAAQVGLDFVGSGEPWSIFEQESDLAIVL